MRRSLRPRTSKIDYAALLDSDGEVSPTEEDGGVFEPEEAEANDVEEHASDSDSPANDDVDELEDEDEEISKGRDTKSTTPKKRRRSSTRGTGQTRRMPGHPRTEGGLYDQRSRTAPLFLRPAQVERLLAEPEPFKQSSLGATNSWNTNEIIADKFSRAVALNVGRGPAWELLEDRSWYKESAKVPEDEVETEILRRPRVHQAVRFSPDLQVLQPR